jgi:hypothetical protein
VGVAFGQPRGDDALPGLSQNGSRRRAAYLGISEHYPSQACRLRGLSRSIWRLDVLLLDPV